MFTRHRRVGGIYKKETAWGKVVAAIFFGWFAFGLIGLLLGS